ncbi:SPOR domain-containing protein [Stenotrophomonas sp. 24(2023)]|uniref:SPOR domain-containing protein n=1 Tax=Stenotrophomonas sp. 24(2023) TaxID=3068324 RepID=UPI0027E125C2|nr:SPOR domain-containing protein [Stenotrophomonas sp. 24(2023)]WMJ68010.1 SPOR domain-containing protein [Stenotrophomonas sp. 24(2023)]
MDTPLKQRLIGAIVLVALAVIFLPMLVKGPAPDSGVASVPIKAPQAPSEGDFETRELPLLAPAGGATGLQSGQAAPIKETAPATPPTVDTSPAVAAGNYAVTFGAYGSQADADAVIAYLKRSQLPGFTETATINGRPAWRVRVGPYADRAQAEAARLQAVKVRADVKAEVITLDAAPAAPAAAASSTAAAAVANPVHSEALPTVTPASKPEPKPEAPKPAAKPDPKPEAPKPAAKPETKPEAKPATAPAAPAASGTGFAVQLGAFGQASDADALRDKVRGAGFSAFVEQVRTEKGTLHRVRVGPVATRAEAEQLKAQVAGKVGVAGMVRPHP